MQDLGERKHSREQVWGSDSPEAGMSLKALAWPEAENFSRPSQINGQSGGEGAVADGPDKLAISLQQVLRLKATRKWVGVWVVSEEGISGR